jgi:WhiB family redox-sensing transcriptional regulator
MTWFSPNPNSPWVELALCAQTDPELFFPEQGGSTKKAKGVCHRCDVRPECLLDALAAKEHFGVRGGFSERERRRFMKSPSLLEQALNDIVHPAA